VEKLERKKQQATSSLKTLDEAIVLFSSLNKEDKYYPSLRDSTIKRFEYSIDAFWKFLKEYLEQKHGITPPASPKGVFKAALDLQVISAVEEEELRLLIENRNLTSHAYNIELAESIAKVIPDHYQVIQKILSRL